MVKSKVGKKHSRKNQKIYKMKGCAKTRKNHLGGSPDAPLAYTGQHTPSVSNPFFAYTGKGGSSCGLINQGNIPVNTNAENPVYPNTGPPIQSNTIFNNASNQHGGSCGGTCSATMPVMQGGSCGCGLPGMTGGRKNKKRGGSCPMCGMGFMVGGIKHRNECKCSECKIKIMKGGNPGIPYPDGLVGSPWTPNSQGWPGVDGISGNRNYIANNLYTTDPQTDMKNIGANPPFLKGGRKYRKQSGGTTSNLFTQDLINLGRQFQFGIGSAYNALAGNQAPINPLPWKGQFPNSPNLTKALL
jgi:hypothetical protein